MSELTREQMQALIAQRRRAADEETRIRRESLRDMPYRAEDVLALLSIVDTASPEPRTTSGLVEMQRRFRLIAQRLGLVA